MAAIQGGASSRHTPLLPTSPFQVHKLTVSLDLYFKNASPGADKEANWLPAPKGPFNLTMRLYAPKSDALTGKWNPPPVMKEGQPTLMQAQ